MKLFLQRVHHWTVMDVKLMAVLQLCSDQLILNVFEDFFIEYLNILICEQNAS